MKSLETRTRRFETANMLRHVLEAVRTSTEEQLQPTGLQWCGRRLLQESLRGGSTNGEQRPACEEQVVQIPFCDAGRQGNCESLLHIGAGCLALIASGKRSAYKYRDYTSTKHQMQSRCKAAVRAQLHEAVLADTPRCIRSTSPISKSAVREKQGELSLLQS